MHLHWQDGKQGPTKKGSVCQPEQYPITLDVIPSPVELFTFQQRQYPAGKNNWEILGEGVFLSIRDCYTMLTE